MSLAPPRREIARVLENRRLSPEIYLLVLRLPLDWGPPRPGQFVQLDCPPQECFGLWRPFSISRFRPGDLGIEIEIVYGPIGTRTRELARSRPGETLNLVGPLGRPFLPFPGRLPVLVGGGRGIAPLLGLADSLKADYPYGTVLFGARSASLLYELPDCPYTVHPATEDGTSGFRGNVVELLGLLLERGELRPESSALFACGPNRMLAALSAWAEKYGFPCQVSIETHFGCGIGICAGCAIPVRPPEGESEDAFGRFRFACVEGPVMEASRIQWEGVPD